MSPEDAPPNSNTSRDGTRPGFRMRLPKTVEQFSIQSTPSTIRMSRSHVLPSTASAP